MNYIHQLNAFEDWLERNHLTGTEQLLWYKLMALNNKFGWSEWFFVTNITLQAKLGNVDEKTLIKYKNKLKQVGLIDFITGKKGSPSKYKILKLYTGESTGNSPVKEENTGNIPPYSPVQSPVYPPVNPPDNINNKPKQKTKTIITNYTANALLVEAIQDFIEMRNKIKKPMTDRALSMMLGELDKLSSKDEEKIAILNQSTMKCWQGVFPLKEPTQESGNKSSPVNPVQVWDKIKSKLNPYKAPDWGDPLIERAVRQINYATLCQMPEYDAKRAFCNAYSQVLKEVG